MMLLVLLLLGTTVKGRPPCGSTPITQSRVIGGQNAQPGAWPWQIALKRYGRFHCGGSLISSDWVVTAAHCVAGTSNPANYKIVVGDHNRNTDEGTEQEVGVRRIISHPSYNRPTPINNDIALIQLSISVTLSQRVNPVCLPNHDSDIPTGSKCYITGWGKIKHPGSSYHILQQAMMPPISKSRCEQKIQSSGVPITFTRQMLCAGVENTILSGCHGDSGGPYVCLNSDKKTYTLHGVVSWGSRTCNAKQIFSVFARVTQFRSWIKRHTGLGAFKCNFDKDLCGFTQLKNDKFDWTQKSGSTSSPGTGPSSDASGRGRYMYIETSYPRVRGDNAKLEKSGLSFKIKQCLSFYYHMYGSSMGTLNVYVGSKKVFTRSGNQGNKWNKASVNITEPGASTLVFEGIKGSSFQGDAAIDNVELRECGEAACNFDSSMCGFTQDKNDKFDWTRKRGRTPSSSTGPSADHTSGNGYYMYIETSSPRRQGDYAILNSPMQRFSGIMCLTFSYHMYGAKIGRLDVTINSRRVFSKSGNQGNRWFDARITIPVSGVYPVKFRGERGSSFTGDIAIDDFSLKPGACSSSVAACNFDSSMCGFTQDKNDKFDWTRKRGRTPSPLTGPSSDHTSGNGYYMYIETSSPRRRGDYAILISPMQRFSGTMCLEFSYHMYGATIGRLDVTTNSRRVFSRSGNQGNRWFDARITISVSGVFSVKFKGERGSRFTGDIAIDDFSLWPGACSSSGR